MSTSQGLGRRRPGHLAFQPWSAQFGIGPLGQDAGKTMANELYFGGYPPAPVQIPMGWLASAVRLRMDPPFARAEVSQTGGATARSRNTASVVNGREWVFTETLDSLVSSDPANLAKWVTDYYTDALPRAAAYTLTLNSRSETEIWRILGVKQGTHVSITGAPDPTLTAASDTFDRTLTADWGAATSGQVWNLSTTAADYGVVGGTQGRIVTTTIAQLYYATLDTGATDQTVRGRIALTVLPTGAAITLRVVGRWTDTSNYYEAELSVATSGAATLFISKRVNGSRTQLASAGVVGTHTAGNTWVIMLDVARSTVSARAWNPSTSADPVAWQVTATDTALTTGTQAGMGVRRETGNLDGATNVDFDDFSVIAPNPHAWPDGATELVVEGITHRITGDRREVVWNTTPIIGAVAGVAGPWFYSDDSRTSSAVVPF